MSHAKPFSYPPYPVSRPRRMRLTPMLREMMRETILSPRDFIYPIFVRHGNNIQEPIASMPGQFQWSVDKLPGLIESISGLGIPAVILFGIPNRKDPIGEENYSPQGIIQKAIQSIKETVSELVVVTDACLCEYTDHGHCGILNAGKSRHSHLPDGYVLNDETLEVLAKVAVSHVEAGADIIAPSGMMDGMVCVIRSALDRAGFDHISILSYAIKYASSFYGPFREAAEGADMLMIKPALPYLDIVWQVSNAFPELPTVAYNVSGEYAMLKAAVNQDWLNEREVVLETLIAIKRAGADLVITYHAIDAARWLTQ